MQYAVVNIEKETIVNVVHKNFAFLEYACSVRKASVYKGLWGCMEQSVNI